MAAFQYFSTYNLTPGSNSSAAPQGAPEGMPPGDLNDSLRQVMAALQESAVAWNTLLGSQSGKTDPLPLPPNYGANDGAGTPTYYNMAYIDLPAQTFTVPQIINGDGNSDPVLQIVADTGADIRFQHGAVQFTIGLDGPNNKMVHTGGISEFQGPVHTKDSLSTEAGIGFVDTANGDATATLTWDGTPSSEKLTLAGGPLEANVTGNLTGNVTGNVTGDLTGNVTGNLTGNQSGGSINATTGTFSSFINATGAIETAISLKAGTHIYADDGNFYARGATSTVARYTYYQNAAGASYGWVGWSGSTAGMVLQDQEHTATLSSNGAAGSWRGWTFSYAGGATALGLGLRGRAGQSGAYEGQAWNLKWESPNAHLWVDNTRLGSIDVSPVSDERAKNVSTEDFDGLAMINALPLKKWRWKDIPADEAAGYMGQKDDGYDHYGVTAQDLLNVFPQAVLGEPDEYYQEPTAWDEETGEPTAWQDSSRPQFMQVNDKEYIGLLLKAVQQLSARVTELENA